MSESSSESESAKPDGAIDGGDAEMPLRGSAEDYLRELMTSIHTMLAFANENGVNLPQDLRKKVTLLLNSPMPPDMGKNPTPRN